MKHEDYQDLYRRALEAQASKDAKRNPLVIPKPFTKSVGGEMGGRPRNDDSPEQRIIRRGIKMGMSYKQIGELLEVSERTVARRIREMDWSHRERAREQNPNRKL